jgi:TolA-binding protein
LPFERKIGVFLRGAAIVLIAAAMSFTSCAYYNTFFFAKKHYKDAARAREQRRDDKATAQEIALYERCIKQCSKVIAEYPDSKYVDDALFLMGASYYHWGRYDDAMQWYEQLQESYPDSEMAREVRYMIALCHLAMYEFVDAENILTEMLPTARGEEREKIMFSLAEVAVEREDMDGAVRYLRSLLKGDPDDRLRLDTHLALGDVYFASGAYDSAAMSYEEVERNSGKREERVEARRRVGQSWQASGDYERALEVYSELLLAVESPPGAAKRDEQEAVLLLRMGECHNSLGDHERAIELFDRVMEDFQQTSVAAEAEYLKGFTYEIYYEDLTRAKTSYDRVQSHFGRSVFIDQAERRSQGIGKLMQYLEEGGTQVEQAEGEGAFMSAELNLFQLNKPEKALQIYRGLEETYPESPLAPKAAYAAAWVLVNKLDREEEGMEEYRRIIENYPYTDYAEGARRLLGLQPIAAQLQGPPLPKNWAPPDSSVIQMLGEGLPDSVATPAPEAIGFSSQGDSVPAPWAGREGAADSVSAPPGAGVPPADTTGRPSGEVAAESDTTAAPVSIPPDTTTAAVAAHDTASAVDIPPTPVPVPPDTTAAARAAPDTVSTGEAPSDSAAQGGAGADMPETESAPPDSTEEDGS